MRHACDVDTGVVRTLGRFVRWGLVHGPAWALLAMLLNALLPAHIAELGGQGLALDLLSAAAAGVVVGPVLGLIVGITCIAAAHLPRWLLDAPDYVAMVAVLGAAAVVVRPLEHGTDPVLSLLALGAVALPALVDAALSAASLLDPQHAERPLVHLHLPARRPLRLPARLRFR